MVSKSKMDGSIGAKNKQKILAAAEKAFATYGFKGTSVQQIADEAELPKTNILYYFKSKQGLYAALLQDIMSLWNSRFDQVTENDDPAESLADYINDKMTMSRTHPQASKIFAMEVLNGAPYLHKYFRSEHVAWTDGRIEILNHWIKQGKMKAVDPQYLLFNIWACTQHYADFSSQITSLRGKAMKRADFDEATRQLIQLVLSGCGLSVPKKYQESAE
ncbi:TetR family transcriptional regulator C-terminal domain-containing protein [Alteromonas lipolytica]|uniref:Transcriptional regulator n=1 Tax=Alteromonas lipolytica TaxID=1856405 RepID=A0A1E8FKC6_9ALTE|nr:TetR family transcriptional regulator C-terminal domain-containing protein [Alteromonas lipolytica]OFI36375.1 transcriptional regulator [Alteromonas lipolytica]GGF70436.1 TetR family transcriptional regulator [Alteromonas lipolytica]